MLSQLSIRNIVLIESLDIPFGKGLCVLTGETGAGKSIILGALGLVLGKRGKGGSLLRHGAQQGSVAAEFSLSSKEQKISIDTFLDTYAIEAEGEALRLRRVVYADGTTKAFINDMPVGVGVLNQLGDLLVEIHGQHDQRGLLDPAGHREVLDAYAGLSAHVGVVSKAFKAYRAIADELVSRREKQATAAREEEYLRHVAEELSALKVRAGEEDTLSELRQRLMQREKLQGVLSDAIGELSGSKDVVVSLQSAQRVLMRSSVIQGENELAIQLREVVDSLERAAIETGEAVAKLERVGQGNDDEETRVDVVEERLFALRAAARKHNRAVDELPVYLQEIRASLALISSEGEVFSQLEADLLKARAEYVTQAELLSASRKKAALKLAKALIAELKPLKMENVQFDGVMTELSEESWGEKGKDRVEFLVSMNPGQPLASMAKVASGGELSRFMLALKAVLAEVKSVPVLIFDEVDTGIGGAVADAVGSRLARLGESAQVLVVTHQPQVASKGSHHLKVEKHEKKGETFTTVGVLDPSARKEELARMLAGALVTDEARAAAERLLAVG
ncbi:MAG: repair protein RecN [Rickettsiales bacterium]|jgi:DNA repair protein RecN (Recombination protein N)|nr:repair protein RecN [Rickettsiales bacterium]